MRNRSDEVSGQATHPGGRCASTRSPGGLGLPERSARAPRLGVLFPAAICIAALLLSCGDTTPAKINYSAPPAVIVENSLHALDAAVVNKKGEPLGGQAVAYGAAPDGVAEVSSSGGLRCLKTGDATLTLAGGGLRSTVPVKCRLPTEISMPRDLQLVVGSAPVALRPQALGEGGRPLDDVPVQITSSNPAIVAIDGQRAKPVSVGRASVRASVGEIVAVTPVEVDEQVVSERVVLADGAARSWTLKQGDYLVTIDVKPDVKIAQGVTVSWAGTNCEGQPEKPSHRFACRVLDAATMTVTNPRQIGVGARVTGTVSILRVPAS